MKAYVWKSNNSVENSIHLDRSAPKFWGPRFQPIGPIGKSGTEGYYVPDEGYYVPDEGYYVPDEGYSRNVVCALNRRTAFLFRKVDPPKKGLKIID